MGEETKILGEITNFDIKYLLPSRIKLENYKRRGWLTQKRMRRFIESKTEIIKILDDSSTEDIIKELLSYLRENPDSSNFLENAKIKLQGLIKLYKEFTKNEEKIKEKIKHLRNELAEMGEKELEEERTRLEEEKFVYEIEINNIKMRIKEIEERINEIKKKEDLLKTKKEELNNLQTQEQKARLIKLALQLTKNINHHIKHCDCRKKKLNVEDVIKMFFDWKKESRITKAQEEATEMIRQLEEMTKKIDKQLEELKEVKVCT